MTTMSGSTPPVPGTLPLLQNSTATLLAGQVETPTDDLMEGLEDIFEANPGYNMAEQYYTGTRPEFFASDRYKRALQRTGTTFRMNYAKTPVDTVVERLEINGVVAGDDPSRRLLEGLWLKNRLDIESIDIHRRACEFGDAYALVWPSPIPDGAEDATIPAEDVGLDIFYQDPRTFRIIYDPENPRKKKFAVKMWTLSKKKGREVYRCNLYYPDRVERYITSPGLKPMEESSWYEFTDEDGGTLDNPFNEIPAFHFRTDRPYGVPEHIDAYGPQDALTKIVITQMNTMDYHGFPQRWALMGNDLDDEEGDDGGDSFEITDEDDVADDPLRRRGNESDLRAEPGHLWLLKNVKSIGQFDAAGSDVFGNPFAMYVRAMAQVSRTPVHRFDETGNPPSGQSLKIREQPLIKKVRYRQMLFGATWTEMFAFCLRVIAEIGNNIAQSLAQTGETAAPNTSDTIDSTSFGINQGMPGQVGVTWANPASVDDTLTWETAKSKLDAGVPVRVVLIECGYTKQQLDEWGVPDAKWEEKQAPPPGLAPPGAPVPPAPPGAPVPPELANGKPKPAPAPTPTKAA